MPCNQDTCPDFTPNNRALKNYARGVRMTRESYPERNTKEVNVPDWHRDCVMYPYEDLCQSPNTLFEGGGSTTTTDPETGETTTSFLDEDQFDDVVRTGGTAGKFYKSLSTAGKWWENRCPDYFRSGGSYSPSLTVSPFKTRYWEHAPSELSFEPNYSDSPFLYLFDTKEHLSGLPCHAICWTLVIIPSSETRGTTYTYTPIKTPYYCDQTPDETYISYSTEDGKTTGPGEKDDDPLIHAVGTRDTGIVFRFSTNCGTAFGDASLRLIGLKKKKNFRRLGRWQRAFNRTSGSTDQWVFTEAGSLDNYDILSSKNPDHRYTTDVQVKEPGTNNLVGTVNITIRPTKSKGDTDYNDAEIRINSLSVGSVEADPDIEYDFRIPREPNPSDIRNIGKIRFTNLIAFSGDYCSQDIESAYSLFVGSTDDNPADENNYVAVDLFGGRGRGRGVGIVNKIGASIWAPGNSGRTSITRTFSFNGSQAIHGGNSGRKLKVKIRMEKFTDEDGESDTMITILGIRKIGYGYTNGQVFPITFTSNGTQYTAGYFRIGGVRGSGGLTSNSSALEMGVPVGFRIAEPKIIGGVYAVSHSSWTSWGNSYAVWCNNKQENLSGRHLEINHHGITLSAGTYQVELGFDDSGKVEILDSETNTVYYTSGNHTGGIPNGSSILTGSFTLSGTKTVDIFVDVENAFIGNEWETNPAGWGVVLKRNGSIVWTTRNAINGVNVGDAYRGMPFEETPYVNSWDGSSGQVFLSAQGNNIWQSKDTVVYKDYSFPGGLKLRMKITAIFDSDTSTFKTAWQIDRVLAFGSGYGAAGRTNFSDDGIVFGDQDVFYLYYPSVDTPKENRIGISLMISETQDTLLATTITQNSLPNGSTVNGWTVEGVQFFDEDFNVAYAKLGGNGSNFTKDTTYTSSNGQNIKVLAGYGIKDRAALFGKYEFTEKEIQYGTAFVSAGVPFEPELIKPQVVAVINNGRVVGAQILKPGRGLSNRNIEPVRLVVDPPLTQFNHELYNQLILQGEDVVKAVKRCTGTGTMAEVEPIISAGRLVNVIIRNGGSGYSQDSPPKISVPYIVKKEITIAQQKTSTAESEKDNQSLINLSPAYAKYNVSTYNNLQQVNYNEVVVSRSVPDIIEMQLSKDMIRYEYPENYMDPNWSDQFNTKNRREYKFTPDVQETYDQLLSKSSNDSKTFIRKSTGTVGNIGGFNLNQEISIQLTPQQRQIASSGAPAGSPVTEPPDNLPAGLSSGAQLQFNQSVNIEKNFLSKTNSTQFGRDGNLDHYSVQFRDFLDAPVERKIPEEDFQNNSATLSNSEDVILSANSFANSVSLGAGGTVSSNRSLSSLRRGFDQNLLNNINEDYKVTIDKIPYPKTPEERQYQLNATIIRSVKGGFYNLPCATGKTKYLLQNFCPDPREHTWINVRLGVRINPDPIDNIGKCTRCLLDNPTLVNTLNQLKSKDPNADISDAFCHVTYPLSSIYGSFLGYTPYTKSYLWSRSIYGTNDNAIVEGIRSWEISGNLEILHDLTQETKTFVDAVNKYGNPYDFLCGRSYGDLGENFKYDEAGSSEEEDLDVPDQLADTTIDGV